jgi:iron complex transport system ATP-binding protein
MLLKPRGAVLVDMRDVARMGKRDLAKIMGYVPQTHSPAFPYRVIDVVMSGRMPHLGFSAPSGEDFRQAYTALERLNISSLAERAYTQISGGELRMVLIARALVQQPRFLLLDEPTSHLDLANRMMVFKAIREIAGGGISVVASEHDPNMATLSSDKVIFLKDGRLLASGSASEVLTEENIESVYGIKAEIMERNGVRYVLPLMHQRDFSDKLVPA